MAVNPATPNFGILNGDNQRYEGCQSIETPTGRRDLFNVRRPKCGLSGTTERFRKVNPEGLQRGCSALRRNTIF